MPGQGQAVALGAVAALWTLHLRRTLANYRANRQALAARRSPPVTVRYDPERAARRGGPNT